MKREFTTTEEECKIIDKAACAAQQGQRHVKERSKAEFAFEEAKGCVGNW